MTYIADSPRATNQDGAPSKDWVEGLRPSSPTLDLVVETYANAHRVNLTLGLLDSLYASYGTEPGAKAHAVALRMAEKVRRPELARTILERMEELHLEGQPDHLGAVPEEPHGDAHAQLQTLHDQTPDPSQEEAYRLLEEEEKVEDLPPKTM